MTPSPNQQESATITLREQTNGGGSEPQPDQLETIREILMGEEFYNLEANIEGRHSELRNEIMAEFGTLQVQSKAEIKGIGEMVVEMVGHLQVEDTAHTEEIEKIGNRLTDLEKRVDDMINALSKQVRKIHDGFAKQMSEFSSIVKSQQEEMARQAVSRTDFAKILNGLAGSLAQQEAEAEDSEEPS